MVCDTFGRKDVIDELREHIKAAGSQRKLAEILGVSETFISHIVHGRSEPSKKLLAYMSIEPVIRYKISED